MGLSKLPSTGVDGRKKSEGKSMVSSLLAKRKRIEKSLW